MSLRTWGIGLLVLWCGFISGQPTQTELTGPSALKKQSLELLSGTTDSTWISSFYIPVRVTTQAIERHLNQWVPKEFHNPEWPNMMDKSVDQPRVKFTVQRDSIHCRGEGSTLYFWVNTRYAIEGDYCPQSINGSCWAPRIPFSCGLGKEGWREMKWVGKVMWSVGQDYKLKAKAEWVELKALNQCEFTFLKIDFTDQILTEMRKALHDVLSQTENQLKNWDLKTPIVQSLEKLKRGVEWEGRGYFSMEPKSISLSQVVGDTREIGLNVFIKASCYFLPQPNLNSSIALPAMAMDESKKKNMELVLVWNSSWLQWNAIIQEFLQEKRWDFPEEGNKKKPDYLIIHQASISSADDNDNSKKDDHQIKLKLLLDFKKGKIKRKNVEVEITATPVIYSDQQVLKLEKMNMDLGTKNTFLEWGLDAVWMAHRLSEWENALTVDYSQWSEQIKATVNEQWKALQWPGIEFNGQINSIDWLQCLPTKENWKLVFRATGESGSLRFN